MLHGFTTYEEICQFIYARKSKAADFHRTRTCARALCADVIPNFTKERAKHVEGADRNSLIPLK